MLPLHVYGIVYVLEVSDFIFRFVYPVATPEDSQMGYGHWFWKTNTTSSEITPANISILLLYN